MYFSLQSFLQQLEKHKLVNHIHEEVSSDLEITEIHKRVIERGGGTLIFHNVKTENGKANMPVICNLFGTVERIALALGYKSSKGLKDLGMRLADLYHPSPPKDWQDIKEKIPMVKDLLSMRVKEIKKVAPCQQIIQKDQEVNLNILPIQRCWPNDIAPLITWGMVITKDREQDQYNAAIYRLQILQKNKLIVRWLKHRGGNHHYDQWQKQIDKTNKMPISVVIGCDPIMLLASVIPMPEKISEYSFYGLLAKRRLEVVKCISNSLLVPYSSEIVLEGEIDLHEMAKEGPFGDHTGFYNDMELFPVMTVKTITMKKSPLYLTTYTGKPVDEPAVLGMALNEIFIPLVQKQFVEITDFWLPPEGCSYRIAIIAIRKSYPGQARRVMMGLWSSLKQFTYTKMIIIVDEGSDIRNWHEVMWILSTHVDFSRDVLTIDNTPMDYLDFASSKHDLGSKIGFDATKKIGDEITRKWCEPITMKQDIIDLVSKKWKKYKIN